MVSAVRQDLLRFKQLELRRDYGKLRFVWECHRRAQDPTPFRTCWCHCLIKKSNDLEQVVSVYIGELADGSKLDLNKVPLKYQGLNGTEITISEFKNGWQLVVRPEDVDAFVAECNKENIGCRGGDSDWKTKFVMHWMVKPSSTWNVALDTVWCARGCRCQAWWTRSNFPEERTTSVDTLWSFRYLAVLSDLNHESKRFADHLWLLGWSFNGQSPTWWSCQITTPTEASSNEIR